MRFSCQRLYNLCALAALLSSVGATSAYSLTCGPVDSRPEPGDLASRDDNKDGVCDTGVGTLKSCGGGTAAEYTVAEVLLAFKGLFSDQDSSISPNVMLADLPSDDVNQSNPRSHDSQWIRTAAISDPTPLSLENAGDEPLDKRVSNESSRYAQLAALDGEIAARAYWEDIPSAIAAYANGLDKRFQKSSRTPDSDLYLVQIGPFTDDQAARSWCSNLLNAGIDCLVAQP